MKQLLLVCTHITITNLLLWNPFTAEDMEVCYFPKEFVISQSHLYKKVAEPGFEPRCPQLQGSYLYPFCCVAFLHILSGDCGMFW